MQDIRDNKFFSKLSTFGAVILVLIAISVIVYFGLKQKGYFLNMQNKDKDHLASIQYICDDKKSLTADFYELKTSTSTDQNISQDNFAPPTPTGSVVLKLSDGRNFELNQTISADGGRYANQDESFVFWEKGDTVIILEFDTEKDYKGCKKYDSLTKEYKNLNFSLSYPSNYSVDESYKYLELGPDKNIFGVKFTIPKNYTDGNNLSTDSYISIENIANSKSCSASSFLANTTTQIISENGVDYSFASSTDAAAGNRYEEYVYALEKNNTCFAIRYFIHYGAIENYDAGKVSSFDKNNIINQFDKIRESINFTN